MLSGLMLAALLMGVAGVPHCATMCGAACAAVWPRGVSWWALAGRCTSYAILGAVASSSAGLASALGKQFSFCSPSGSWRSALSSVWGCGCCSRPACRLGWKKPGRAPFNRFGNGGGSM